MALYVQKFGGTSVGTTERIQSVAKKVAGFKAQGHDVVVVVSAMSGETNRLLSLSADISEEPDERELDVLLSTGEQVTISLLSMALKELGFQAKSYTGSQVKILTDNKYGKARILEIDERNVRKDLSSGRVVVVAGFQGVRTGSNRIRVVALEL